MIEEFKMDKPSWKLRRLTIFGLLIFAGLTVMYVILFGDPDSNLHSTALVWGYGTAVATVFTYAGWATIEDISLAKLFR